MTIGQTVNRVSFNTDGVTTVFPVNLQSYLASDFTAILTNAAGVETTLTLNSDYSLVSSGTLAPPFWTLTRIGTAWASGQTLQVFTNPTQIHQTQYVQGQAFPSLAVQTDFDRLTQMVQRLQDQVTRSVHAPDGDVNPLMALPSAIQRALNYLTFDSLGNLSTAVGVVPGTVLSAAVIGSFTGPATPAEAPPVVVAAPWLPSGNLMRYGLVPDAADSTTAANNLAILNALFNGNAQPPAPGPTGDFWFPNPTGKSIYTIGGAQPTIACRPGIRIHGNNVVLNVVGTSSANDVNVGFLYALSDFVLEDITINSNVNTAAGNNAAACLQFGARGAGFYFGTVTENTWSPSFGRIVVRNVTLVTNNTGGNSSRPIQILGGHSDVLIQNVTINCNSIAGIAGIYYEYGYYSNPGGTVPGTTVTTHAKNMTFENIRVLNSSVFAVDVRGCYNCIIDGLYGNGCAQLLDYNPGQAMFYNVSPNDAMGAKRNMTFRNLVGQSCTVAPAVQLAGSNAAIGGIPPNAWGQTDLMTFSIDGVSAPTMTVSGNFTLHNANLDAGGAFLNPLTINDDVRSFEVVDCRIVGGTGSGIRVDVAGTGAWSPPRQKLGTISKCLIAGNVTSGIELNNVQALKIEYNQIGFNALNDPAGEASQNIGVLVASGCNGVICDSNYVTVSGSIAYSITGLLSNGCNVVNPMGVVTTSGNWDVNGVAQSSLGTASTGSNVQGLANKTTYPNGNVAGVSFRYPGKLAQNLSNGHLYISAGSAVTSNWVPVDAADTGAPPTITPA